MLQFLRLLTLNTVVKRTAAIREKPVCEDLSVRPTVTHERLPLVAMGAHVTNGIAVTIEATVYSLQKQRSLLRTIECKKVARGDHNTE